MFRLIDGGFKSSDARRRYLATYDELRALTPPPDVVLDVPTEFGIVRVYQHGPSGGVPVVLVHGFYLTSAMWCEQIKGLTGDFTVYTMDMLGQPGASIRSKPALTAAGCARTIDAVLAGIGLRDVHLVGHSNGGWHVTQTAAREPSRLATVTLIDPASTVTRLSVRCWRHFGLLGRRPRSVRAQRGAAWIMGQHAPGSFSDMLTGLFVAGFAAFTPPMRGAFPFLPSVRLLRSVHLPVQVLLAGNTVHNSDKGIRRIASVVPGWRYRLWPKATHALPAELPDEVNASIRQFVKEHRDGA